MRGVSADLRLAARRLLATPLFTIFAVLSLAIGVGVTTGVYSVVDSIFLRGLGIRDPERLVFVVTPYDGRWLQGSTQSRAKAAGHERICHMTVGQYASGVKDTMSTRSRRDSAQPWREIAPDLGLERYPKMS